MAADTIGAAGCGMSKDVVPDLMEVTRSDSHVRNDASVEGGIDV